MTVDPKSIFARTDQKKHYQTVLDSPFDDVWTRLYALKCEQRFTWGYQGTVHGKYSYTRIYMLFNLLYKLSICPVR
jgi:hypothetical protein